MTDHRHISGVGFVRVKRPEQDYDRSGVSIEDLCRPHSARVMPKGRVGSFGHDLSEAQAIAIQRQTTRTGGKRK